MNFASRTARLLARILMPASIVVLAACSSSEERAQNYYESGLNYVEQGELSKASLEFRNALKLDGNFVGALFELAKVEEQQQNFAGAVKLFISVTEHDAEHIAARVHLSYILLAAGQIDLAKRYAEEAYAIDETDPRALVAVASVKLKLGEQDEAVRFANEALTRDPENTDALMVLATERLSKADPEQALAILDKAPADSERNVGLQMLRMAALDASGDQAGVEQLFLKLIDLFPDNQGFRGALINWYLNADRVDDAERVLRDLGKVNSADTDLQLRIVSFLSARRGPDAARQELERLIEQSADDAAASSRYQMALAQLEFTTGDKDKAIALAQSIVETSTDTESKNQALVALARMQANEGKNDAAFETVSKAIEADPGNSDALSVRASILLLQDKPEDAIKDLLVAVNEAPDTVGLHGLLAEAYERTGSVPLAEQEFGKALTLDDFSPATAIPYAQFLIRYGKSDQALRTLETVRSRSRADRRVLTLLAQLKLDAGDWTGAEAVSQEMSQLGAGDSDPSASQIRAAALSGLNRYDESINLLEDTIATSDNLTTVLPDLIATYVRSGRSQDAVAYLESIIEKDSNNIQARVLLGSVYSAMNEAELAEQAFAEAAEMDDGVVGDVALAQFYLSSGQFDKAEEATGDGLAKNAESASLQFIRAAVFERDGRFDEAIDVYENLFAQNPGSAIAANDLASLLSERRGDPESIDRAFEIAQRFSSSKVPQYLDTLGWIYYLREDYASALPLLRTAANALPNAATVHMHLGLTLTKLNQMDAAKNSLETALSITPPLIQSDVDKINAALEAIADGTAASEVQTQ